MKPIVVLIASLVALPAFAQEMNRCIVGGRSVIQEAPCAAEKPTTGKFRCFVDDEVRYSDVSCAQIKSKEVLAKEAKEVADAERAKNATAAKLLEKADRPNFSYRIAKAEKVTAQQLRDPDSARFKYTRVSWFSGFAVVCGMVSGRNGFGGYSNPVRFFAIDDLVTVDENKSYLSFDDQWAKYCGS
ncbi:MAG: hypothetical protein WAV95_15870 [Azonexus sp.]